MWSDCHLLRQSGGWVTASTSAFPVIAGNNSNITVMMIVTVPSCQLLLQLPLLVVMVMVMFLG